MQYTDLMSTHISVAPVKELAEKRYGTIKAFADAAGLHYATAYRYWRNEVQLIDPETLVKIADALGVEPGDLIKRGAPNT